MTERKQPESQRTIGQQLLSDVTEAAWALEPGASSERTASIFAEVAAHLLDGTMERIAELEAQLEAVGAGGVEPLRKRCLHQISEPQAQPVVAAPWQPIATAPEGNPVVVFWLDAEDVEHPERHEFDYLEDGVWQKHDDNYQHFCAAAPPGSCGPRELPPYTHWMPLTSPQDGATTSQPAAQALYSVRVFWQQHTQADTLSMMMAELHNDVELVIRAARGAAQAAPRNGALAAPAQAATAKQSPHPEYDKGFSDGWNRCEERQAAALASSETVAVPAAGPVGFDHKTAANFLNGKTVTDEDMRRFVACSRWAHDDRDGLRNTVSDLRREIAQRDAEIALLKISLLAAEQPAQAQEDAKDAAIEARQGGAA